MNNIDTNVLKHIFFYILRWDTVIIPTKFMALNSTCKNWNRVLSLQLEESDKMGFDEIFGRVLDSLIHNFDRPPFESYFKSIVRFSSPKAMINNLIPIDHCTYCGKLRNIFREGWCDDIVGCHKWICNQRRDPYDKRCMLIRCSPWIPTEKMVNDKAYYIYLETGRDDPIANYYEALKFWD